MSPGNPRQTPKSAPGEAASRISAPPCRGSVSERRRPGRGGGAPADRETLLRCAPQRPAAMRPRSSTGPVPPGAADLLPAEATVAILFPSGQSRDRIMRLSDSRTCSITAQPADCTTAARPPRSPAGVLCPPITAGLPHPAASLPRPSPPSLPSSVPASRLGCRTIHYASATQPQQSSPVPAARQTLLRSPLRAATHGGSCPQSQDCATPSVATPLLSTSLRVRATLAVA